MDKVKDKFYLELAGVEFLNWTEIEMKQSLDCFSSVGFTAPFEPERKDFRDKFRPFSFTPIKLYLGGDLVFTGQLFNVEPDMSSEGRSVKVQCVSRAAVLESCCVPAVGPKDPKVKAGGGYRGLAIKDIASDLCAPFGLKPVFAQTTAAAFADANAFEKAQKMKPNPEELNVRFPSVKYEPESTVHEFLCTLAQELGFVLSDDAEGNPVFQIAVSTGNAVVHLEEGKPPLVSVTPHFEPSAYFSEVTCRVPKKRGAPGAAWTEQNPFLKGVVRPTAIRATNVKHANASAAARAHMGRMFGNMASWDVELPTFFDSNKQDRRFRPNTTITLKAPSAMVYGTHEILVRDVTLRADANSNQSATLGLVLPGAFSGVPPVALPWSEAL